MLEVVVPALRGALQYAPSFQVRERAAQGLLLLVSAQLAFLARSSSQGLRLAA